MTIHGCLTLRAHAVHVMAHIAVPFNVRFQAAVLGPLSVTCGLIARLPSLKHQTPLTLTTTCH